MTTYQEIYDLVTALPEPYRDQSLSRLAGASDGDLAHLEIEDADSILDLRLKEHGLLRVLPPEIAAMGLVNGLALATREMELAGALRMQSGDAFMVPFAGHRFIVRVTEY